MRRLLWWGVLLGLAPGGASAQAPAPTRPPAYVAELQIQEVGFTSSLRIRLFYQQGLTDAPAALGRIMLVCADQGTGRDAFFIPTDLAFEVGAHRLYRVEFEQAADFLGQALGGRLGQGEQQLGILVLPELLGIDAQLPAHPDSIVARYGHHRAVFRPAEPYEQEAWLELATGPRVTGALNVWWEWSQLVANAPPMEPGESRLFAERIFPGQGHIVTNEAIPVEAIRNAVLRVGERRMNNTPSRQRVAPSYPTAARQMGASGLVIALCYVDPNGTVQDATVLASNTVHMLNLSALSAALDWRFGTSLDEEGNLMDGWRLLPFQFKLTEGDSAVVAPAPQVPVAGKVPPRIVKYVDPGYPVDARKYRKAEGTVIYTVLIDARGKLVGTRLDQGVHPILDQAALTALESMYFAPATENGVAVDGQMVVPFEFTRPR